MSQWQCTISQQETVPDLRQPKDWWKRWDLVSRRNVSIEEAALICGGRLFHARAAATGNARSPRVNPRVDGTSNVGESTERRRRAMILDEAVGQFGKINKINWNCCTTIMQVFCEFVVKQIKIHHNKMWLLHMNFAKDTLAPVRKCRDTSDMPKCPRSEVWKVRSVLGPKCPGSEVYVHRRDAKRGL